MTLDPRRAPPGIGYYGQMRAASVDRERAVDVLRAGFAEGRLTKDEFDGRVERVYASRTYGDLAVLTADLPTGPLGTMTPPAQFAPWAGWPGYPQQPYPPPYYRPMPAPRRINGTAIAAFLFAFIPGPLSIAGIALGIDARTQIRRRGDGGAALANAAIIISVITTLALVLLLSQF
jgi:hypothetical protein